MFDERDLPAEDAEAAEAYEDAEAEQLDLGADDERLPWLEGDDDDQEPGVDTARIAAFGVIGLLVIVLIVGGIWWATRGGSAAAQDCNCWMRCIAGPMCTRERRDECLSGRARGGVRRIHHNGNRHLADDAPLDVVLADCAGCGRAVPGCLLSRALAFRRSAADLLCRLGHLGWGDALERHLGFQSDVYPQTGLRVLPAAARGSTPSLDVNSGHRTACSPDAVGPGTVRGRHRDLLARYRGGYRRSAGTR